MNVNPIETPDDEIAVSETAAIAEGLKVLLKRGLPVTPETAPPVLLALPSVTARSVDPASPAARADALERLVRSQLQSLGLSELRAPAKVLFGIGALGSSLTTRRGLATERADYHIDHFRKRVEPKIIRQLAWQIARDGLQYVGRTYGVEPLAPSGVTPTISDDDLDNDEGANKQILLSRIWSDVYGLRAELITYEHVKDDPERSAETAEAETGTRWYLARLLTHLDRWTDKYGHQILHGNAEFNAEALIRLAGWSGELTAEQSRELRFRLARAGEWERWAFTT